jgi:AcrR family transcriptional regulator
MSTRKIARARAAPRLPTARPGQVGGTRDANRGARIRQICSAALALYLRHGIASVTIDQIVQRAEIAKGSFYRYFTDQEQLVETLLAPMAAAMRAGLARAATALAEVRDPDALPAIYLALATELTAAVTPEPDVLRLYLQECRSPLTGACRPVRALADDIAHRSIALSQVAKDFDLLRDTDPRVGALTVIGAVERLAFAVLAGEDVGGLAALPRTFISVILDGVRRPRG